MPANDGQSHTWFSILSNNNNRVKIETLPLDYDASGAAEMMKSVGLDNGYAKALEQGLWPSMDILPQQEKQQQGLPLQLTPTYF